MSYNRWMPRQYYSGGELYHHGVKGMKWGVRRKAKSYLRRTKRDLYMLNDRNYNQTVRKLKDKRDFGKIDTDEYRSAKKEAKRNRKQTVKDIKSMKAQSSLAEATKQFKETRARAAKEIPHYRLKRGARTVSTLISGIAAGTLAVSTAQVGLGAAMLGASFGSSAAAAYGAGGAVAIAATGGSRMADHVIRKKINQAMA